MYRCPSCQTPLEVSALLSLSSLKPARCNACGQRYRWYVSGPLVMLMLVLIVSSLLGLALSVQQVGVMALVLGGLAVIGATAYLAVCALRPVVR